MPVFHSKFAKLLPVLCVPLHGAATPEQQATPDCGGWFCTGSTAGGPLPPWAGPPTGDRCDIEVVGADEVHTAWPGKPFVVRGGAASLSTATFSRTKLLALARKSGMLAKWGSSDRITANYGEGPEAVPMEEFITSIMHEPMHDVFTGDRLDSPYAFQRFPGKGFRLPPALAWLDWQESFFMLGAEGSGVSWHRHNAAAQMVVYGHKRWLLLPPSTPPPGGGLGFWSIFEWLRVVHPTLQGSLRPLECVVGPGDAIYVPENWFHAIANVRGDSVAISLQADSSRESEAKRLFDSLGHDANVTQRIEVLERILKLHPTDVDTRYSLSKLYLLGGDREAALDSFGHIVRDDPFHIDSMYRIVSILSEQEKRNEQDISSDLLRGRLRSFEPMLVNGTNRSLLANSMLATWYDLVGDTESQVDVLSRNAALQSNGSWFGDALRDHNFTLLLEAARRGLQFPADRRRGEL